MRCSRWAPKSDTTSGVELLHQGLGIDKCYTSSLVSGLSLKMHSCFTLWITQVKLYADRSITPGTETSKGIAAGSDTDVSEPSGLCNKAVATPLCFFDLCPWKFPPKRDYLMLSKNVILIHKDRSIQSIRDSFKHLIILHLILFSSNWKYKLMFNVLQTFTQLWSDWKLKWSYENLLQLLGVFYSSDNEWLAGCYSDVVTWFSLCSELKLNFF